MAGNNLALVSGPDPVCEQTSFLVVGNNFALVSGPDPVVNKPRDCNLPPWQSIVCFG